MITKISILSKFQNKKTIRVISSLVIAIAMVFSSMAFVDYTVKAETTGGTYYKLSIGCNELGDQGVYGKLYYFNNCATTSDVRFVCFKSSNSNMQYVFTSDSSLRGKFSSMSQNGCTAETTTNRPDQVIYNGITYYYYRAQSWANVVSSPVPVITVDNATNVNASTAIRYAFGDLAVDPIVPSVYGSLKDLTFSSSIVGSGNGTGEANMDTIKWYPFADSNNKMFGTGGSVEIRVVPGDYISQSQEGIFTQTYTNFVLDVGHAGHLATVQAYTGTYSVNWGTVMQKLSASWPALELLWDGEYWKKLGWVYQVRYQFEEDEGTDTWSDWQTVYNITSSTPSGTEGLDPADGTALPGFYENVVDAFNTTSVVNNNSNVTYYVNNIQYIVNENPDEPSDDVTNDLLREIRNITIQIRQLIVEQNNDGDEKDPEDTGLNDKDKELHDKEKELIDDMDDKLNDIDTDVDLITTDGFLGAAQWVRAQYDHLTLNTPFELVIVFALVLGIGLIFIGKVR